jgi:2-keto-4-pentenoate hydratase
LADTGDAGTRTDAETARVAHCFVSARRQARALAGYPGTVPASLAEGYARQEAAIAMWPDEIVGWKVGRIPDAYQSRLGADRLAGPIFARSVQIARDGAPVIFPVIAGGFAAVEAEYVVQLAHDAPPNRTDWTLADAADLVGAMHIGVEPAGSPLSTINDLGPAVVVSDFGNNAGLILGVEIPDWRERDYQSLTCATWIEGTRIGVGGAANLIDGPLGSLCFVLELCARRGRPLRAGMFVSTGAATGIHDIVAGQSARLVFDGYGEIACLAAPAQPLDGAHRGRQDT